MMKRFILILFIAAWGLCSLGKTFSTRGKESALGIDLSIEYPEEWNAMDIVRPNLVAAFGERSNDKTTYKMAALAISTISADEYNMDDIKASFCADDYPSEYVKEFSSELMDSKKLKKNGIDYWQIKHKKRDPSGLTLVAVNNVYMFENAFIELACSVVSISKNVNAEELFAANEGVFLRVLDSLAIDKSSKPIKEASMYDHAVYESDYDEFVAGETFVFDSNDYAENEFVSFSFKYPKSWGKTKIKTAKSDELDNMAVFASLRSVSAVKTMGVAISKNFSSMIFSDPRIMSDRRYAEKFLAKEMKISSPCKVEYVFVGGVKSISFEYELKRGEHSMKIRQVFIPLKMSTIIFTVNYISSDKSADIDREFEADKKLYDKIFCTVEITATPMSDFAENIRGNLHKIRREGERLEKEQSLPAGEWATFSIPELCSFQIPPTMEAEGGSYKDQLEKALKNISMQNEAKITFQQKGLNKLDEKSLKEYCRIFVYVSDADAEERVSIKDPLPLSEEDLGEIHKTLKSAALNYPNDAMGMKVKHLSIKKPRLQRIEGIDCLYFEEQRQMGDNPPMHVASYTFFNYDKVIRFSVNYRIKDREKWEPQIREFLKTVKFYDRSAGVKKIPPNAKSIEGKIINGHLYLPVKISGDIGNVDTYLLFDSGATVTIIPRSLFNAISTSKASRPSSFKTFSGAEKMNVYKLKLEIGGVAKKIDVAVSDKSEFGAIGLNFFNGCKYIIDMNSSKIHYWTDAQ